MSIVPPGLSPVFQRAGWFERRCVAVDASVPSRHPAYAVLAELGGIVLRDPAPNLSSIAFRSVREAAPVVAQWEAELATNMVGVAEQDGAHAELYLTERGQVVGCSLVHPACWLVGPTFEAAMLALAEGRRSKPMMLPGQRDAMLYGIRFQPGDAEVLGPADLA